MRILVVASTLPAGQRLKVALGHEGLMVDTVALDEDPGAVAAQTGPYDAILIEAAGLKGHRIGGAAISAKHANFIVNLGGATAADIEALMAIAQDTVRDRFGVELEREVRVIGVAA